MIQRHLTHVILLAPTGIWMYRKVKSDGVIYIIQILYLGVKGYLSCRVLT